MVIEFRQKDALLFSYCGVCGVDDLPLKITGYKMTGYKITDYRTGYGPKNRPTH